MTRDDVDLVRMEVRNRLLAALEALEAALGRSETDAEEALATARRLAATFPPDTTFGPIARAARALLAADDAEALAALDDMVQVMRRVRDALDLVRPDERRTRVLVVEPDVALATALADRLAVAPREVVTAPDRAGAERLLAGAPFDAIVLALVLPDGDGRDLLAWLRAGPHSPGASVLVVSGVVGAEAECFALGADAYFERPVDPGAVNAALAVKLSRAAASTRVSRRDGLTGLCNRAGLSEAFTRLAAQGRRDGVPLSVGIIDVDRFKAVNDTHGHATGDAALRAIARVMTGALRRSDVLGRWGGDELVALLPGATRVEAAQLLARAQAAVTAHALLGPTGAPVELSVSIGVAELAPDQPLEVALEQADAALYEVKAAGGGAVSSGGTPTEGRRRPTIVIVADSSQDVDMLQQGLGSEGLDVARFSGLEDLGGAPAEVALWILDLDRGVLDGLELLRDVRRRPTGANAPILVIGASGRPAELARAFEQGADDYVVRPLSLIGCIARVRRLLRPRARRLHSLRPGQVSGAFVGDQLLEFVQMLGASGKRGLLRVESRPSWGRLGFLDGRIVLAEAARAGGLEDAAFETLSLRHGRFEFDATAPVESGCGPGLTVEAILLEVLRRRDEVLAGA